MYVSVHILFVHTSIVIPAFGTQTILALRNFARTNFHNEAPTLGVALLCEHELAHRKSFPNKNEHGRTKTGKKRTKLHPVILLSLCLPASHPSEMGSIPGQVMWGLWSTSRACERSLRVLHIPLPICSKFVTCLVIQRDVFSMLSASLSGQLTRRILAGRGRSRGTSPPRFFLWRNIKIEKEGNMPNLNNKNLNFQ
jgi:hypothetical protein